MSERNLVAVSIKHTEFRWKFGMPCWLWGHRTKDDEKRIQQQRLDEAGRACASVYQFLQEVQGI